MIKSLLQQPALSSIVTHADSILKLVTYLVNRLLYIASSMSVMSIDVVTH